MQHDTFHKMPRKTNNSLMAQMRIKRGLTQAQLAAMIGVYQKDISRWEKGLRNPNVSNLKLIATALGCTMEDLI